ncbi:DeoR/GlpR family DNA-binding transcription regulator [Clostridium sp. JNZ J1-5]
MIPAERENYIVEKLNKNGSVKVEEIANELGISLMTVRRDLGRLEEKGLLYRSHGGAVLRSLYPLEQAYDLKKISNIEAKEKIAIAALDKIKDGDTIFLDAGTTTFELSRLLKNKTDITVITNDLKIALELYQNRIKVFIVGGKIQEDIGCTLGPTAEEFIESIRVNIAFVGTSSITSDWYLSTPSFEKSSLKKKIINSSSYSVLIADSSKFNKESFVKVASIKELNAIITDKIFNEAEINDLNKFDVEIIKL